MPRRSSKKRARHLNELAAGIVGEATETGTSQEDDYGGKNPHAVELGRLGGVKGGAARAAKLSPEERRRIAIKAAQARWSKK